MPTFTQSWPRLRARFARVIAPSRVAVVAFAVVTLGFYLKTAARLPQDPVILYDSRRYLEFVDYLPPGYFLFLSGYKALFGSLAYLPHAQLGLLTLGFSVLGLAVAKLSRNILAAYFVVMCGVMFMPSKLYATVMSDPLFGAIMAAGAGVFVFYCARPSTRLLLLASALFALSAAVRTIGEVLPIAMLLTLSLLIVTRRASPRAVAVAAAATVPVLMAAAGFTYVQSGHFKIGSTGGDSLLGKALLIATPLPADNPYSQLNWVADEVRPAQEGFAKAKDPVLQMLMARQYYEHLRWQIVFPAFSARWPGWKEADFGQQGEMAEPLARAYIAARPAAYAKLAALDYLALWTIPHHVTTRERNILLARFDALGPVAFLRQGEKLTDDDYRWVVGRHRSRADVWSVRLASAAFFFGSAVVGVLLLTRRQARLAPSASAVLALCAMVHGSFLGTALHEAGLERYAAPSWPLILALLPLLPTFLRESFAPQSSSSSGRAPARARGPMNTDGPS